MFTGPRCADTPALTANPKCVTELGIRNEGPASTNGRSISPNRMSITSMDGDLAQRVVSFAFGTEKQGTNLESLSPRLFPAW
jgi:hypothetical protein